MSDQPTKAVLEQAFVYTCPNCHHRNFVEVVAPTISSEEQEAAYRKFNELEEWQELPSDWQEFELVTCPTRVTCPLCNKNFATTLPSPPDAYEEPPEEESDEDDDWSPDV